MEIGGRERCPQSKYLNIYFLQIPSSHAAGRVRGQRAGGHHAQPGPHHGHRGRQWPRGQSPAVARVSSV